MKFEWKKWLLQAICTHDYAEIKRNVYRDYHNKETHLVITTKCKYCGKVHYEDYYTRA